MVLNFQIKSFKTLSNSELYQILQLRTEVFVVEQNCIFQDMDGYDEIAYHILGKNEEKLIAYGRIIPPNILYNQPSLGRIVVKKEYRKYKLGYQLMEYILKEIKLLYPNLEVKIMAQSYLIPFYESFGFKKAGNEFMEDDILHWYMILN